MARSAQSRLFDNIGRRIRHLNEDLRKSPDDFRRAGLERHKEQLEKFRNELREQAGKNPDGKLTNEQIYEATDRMKTDKNLTTKKKDIDNITRKLISEEPQEIFEEFEDSDIEFIMAQFASISGKYIGQSGDEILRATANSLIETAQTAVQYNDYDESIIEILNKMSREIEKALSSKGASGVVFPIGARK